MNNFKLDKDLMGLEEEAHTKAQDLVIKLCNFMDALKLGKSSEYPHGVCSNAALEIDSLCAIMHYNAYVKDLIIGVNCTCHASDYGCDVHDKKLS